ncbi:Type II secretory pathway, pullulanase PulA [Roseovarius spongiae]|uniref:Type II secretory pathway, pullulanase PulA n=1 Tax=Roseovarius spongiae TaxID=2320272 RepID=A0A3A8AYN5_9RHOB|nr:sulfotransferase family 2 domain-containing protein [Roseovarius spongiae]RKF16579.1 Type II secretory pathway, pullulanase PulA [Roseovarius spongiae]
MIISAGRNYIFVHIPKTGGTAMALALEGRAMKDDILIGDTPKAKRRRGRLKGARAAGRLWKHSTLADIDALTPRAQIARAFTFTLVRNPWDRMVSYYHWLRDQRFDHPAVRLAGQVGFADFIAHPMTEYALQSHPYAHYMTDAEGVERASAYLRIERLAEDAAPLWAHLGFTLELPRVNASRRDADYRHYYTDAGAERIAALCAADIARFGYRF